MEKRECSYIENVPHHITCALATGAGAEELIAAKGWEQLQHSHCQNTLLVFLVLQPGK